METSIRRACLFALLAVSLLWGSPSIPLTAADNPPSTSPVLQAPSLVYPLARRYPMTSLFDHSGPSSNCADRDGILTIYTGATVRDDPGDPGDYVEAIAASCVWRVTDWDPKVKDLRWNDFEQPGWLYYDRHGGYDLPCAFGTSVIAAAAGTTGRSGNFAVYVTHSDGSRTYYRHLSSRISAGMSVQPGQWVGNSGDEGGTLASHLHFEMRNASLQYIDPYGYWASGDPIPMGYRDQNNNDRGPYALDHNYIRWEWFARDGEPGSPLGNDYGPATGQDEAVQSWKAQMFEHGAIVYDVAGGTQYYPFAETYLPDVRASNDDDGWNSVIFIRNNDSIWATVNVTFYTPDGRVLDSRTNTSVPARGTWKLAVRGALRQDFLNQAHYEGVFEGSATVYASQDVSVVVMNIHKDTPYATGSYVGLRQAATTLYLPLLQRATGDNTMYSDFTLFNVSATQAWVQVQYIPENAGYDGCTTNWIAIPANGSHNFNLRLNPECAAGDPMSSPFIGGARVFSSQPLGAVANNWRDYGADGSLESFMSYEAFTAGYSTNYLPLLQRNNDGGDYRQWYTSITFQDTAGSAQPVHLYYFPENAEDPCGNHEAYFTNGIARVFPSPPGGVCGAWNEKFVGAARVTRGYPSAAVILQENFAKTSRNRR